MKKIILLIFITVGLSVLAQDCEIQSIEDEMMMTENIALVTTDSLIGDSLLISVVKKWKGDSIPKQFKIKQAGIVSKYYRLDTGKVYMLFWFHGFGIDPCSRTSEYKYTYFEFQLNKMFDQGEVVDVSRYDSIVYQRKNIFKTQDGKLFDRTKGNYAFYDVEANQVLPWEKLPKETSFLYPVQYYFIEGNLETAKQKYDAVIAVYKSDKPLQITQELKKNAIKACFAQ